MRKGKNFERPAGEIRRSQVISTYGAGAMVDLTDKSVLISGTDDWKYGKNGEERASVIQEPRMQRLLAPRLAKFQPAMKLDVQAPFRAPPTTTGDTPGPWQGMGVQEFPRWFVCQNPQCRQLWKPSLHELPQTGGLVHAGCDGKRKWECVPVRFVGTCLKGHLQDFPWVDFCHPEGKRCTTPALKLTEGATGDFADIFVSCACGKSRALLDAMVENRNPKCWGNRPWLHNGDEDCDHPLRLLARTATNTYFSHCESALSIPEPDRALEGKVAAVLDMVGELDADDLARFRKKPESKVAQLLAGVSDENVLAAVEQLQAGAEPPPSDEDGLRTAEYLQLMAQPDDKGEFPPRNTDFFARRLVPAADAPLPPQLDRIVLARKLREVRVQLGFTRSEPVTADLEGECDLDVELARVGLHDDWLPACEIRGEGLFLNLSEQALQHWEQLPAVVARERELRAGHAATVDRTKSQLDFPGVRFYLLHSLSHLLITAISLECGYSASAIRERIYCAKPGAKVSMAAILLSTGTPGSEGTLGGLVEQGPFVLKHLRRAYDDGLLCANDPVCASHSPRNDPAERFYEGAACHGCLYIAEPSCERFNRYLDRALVVPTLGADPKLAFFADKP